MARQDCKALAGLAPIAAAALDAAAIGCGCSPYSATPTADLSPPPYEAGRNVETAAPSPGGEGLKLTWAVVEARPVLFQKSIAVNLCGILLTRVEQPTGSQTRVNAGHHKCEPTNHLRDVRSVVCAL
jgi:hypothetical protein